LLVKDGMTKLLALVIVGFMVIQLIKPIGWPGLKRRSDFWKLALLAMAAMSLAAVLGHLT
jgi:phosphoglycerol transferase MdoB-like AlkP superfamily enzyme